MNRHRVVQLVSCGILWLAGTLAVAGTPSVVPFISPSPFASTTLASSGVGISSPVQSITVLCNSNSTASGCLLETLSIVGANAADFSIVPGGTCVPGSTNLLNGGTCTVNVQYRPSSSGQESALLQASCIATAQLGGFNVLCDRLTHPFDNLLGFVIIATPALDRTGMTLLALLIVVTGVYFAFRRPGKWR